MIVVLIILSIGLLGVIIYFAISPKSSRLLKLCSVAALGLIALSLLVSGFFIIKGPSEDPAAIPLPVLSDTPAQPKSKFKIVDIVVLVVFVSVIGFVMARAMKDQKGGGTQGLAKKYKAPEVVKESDDLTEGLDYHETGFDDESFDTGLD